MNSTSLLLALLHLGAPSQSEAPMLQPFSAERSWQVQRLGAPTISSDGTRVVCSVTRFDMEESKGIADLWMWSIYGGAGRRLTTQASSDGSPQFSPDGKRVLFVSKREGDKAPQLYVIPIDGGEAERVTRVPTGVAQPLWFPDGERIAFLTRVWPDLATFEEQGKRLEEREKSKSTARAWEGAPVTAWDQWIDDERELHVFAIALAGGEPEALTLGTGLQLPRSSVQFESALYAISPDGRELAFTADSSPAPSRTNLDLYTLTIGEKVARNHTADNEAADAVPSYSPDGRWLAFARQRIRGFYADTRRLALLDRASGALRVLHEDWDRSADGLVWAPDSSRLYGAIDDAGTVRVHELPLDGAPRPLTGSSSVSALAISSSEPAVLVGLRQSFLEPPTLVRIDPASGEETKLSATNDELLRGTDLGSFESVTFTGARGAPVQMWVNYPPGFDRKKRYPLFLLIHGGPHNAITNGMQFRWNAQVFGSWGFVTGWPNFHGSSGFGQAFADSINPRQDELPYQDVLAAARWFTTQPWIDADRMGAGGGSYGGYLSSILLGREHPFKALIAHAAVYNLYTQLAADYGTEVPRFGSFWTSPEREADFRASSPHHGAGNFATPTLVIHGARDYRVPLNHGLELYHTLVQRGVPARLLYYPDENHWVLSPQNSLTWYREVRAWLERWVLALK